jgi:hypothetical protein
MFYTPPKRHTSEACGPGQRLAVARLVTVITTRSVPSAPTALPRGAAYQAPRPTTTIPSPRAGRGSGEPGPIGGIDARFPSVHTRAEPNN